MSNKPMLSVERALIEEMLAAMKETHSLPAKFYGSTLGDRVRVILESQNEQAEPLAIGTLHRDCDERIVFESSGEVHIKDGMQVYAEPAAQHQGEPVMPGSEEFSHMSTIELRGYHAGWRAACMQNRSAEKPAPVAVVMPGRPRADEEEYERMSDYDKGLLHGGIELWDKIDKLNGVKP